MISKLTGTALLALLFSSGAWAEIYKTTDEEGNTVFTDTPPTQESEVVDLPEANIADSVEPAPPSPDTGSKKDSGGQVGGQPLYDVPPRVGGDDNDLLDAKMADERREEIRRGEKRPGEIDVDSPRDTAEVERHERAHPAPHSAPRAAPRR